MTTQPVLIHFDNLKMAFEGRTLFEHLTFDLPVGDFFCLVGANGTGKTTLTQLILGRLAPTAGQLSFPQGSLPAAKIGYVPQFRELNADYPLSIENFVALRFYQGLRPWLTQAEKERVAWALAQTGLTSKRRQRLGQSSGGEKQRAYLAQALLAAPKLLILDEPTASLDQQAKFEVLQTVHHINQQLHTTIMLISHDLTLVEQYGQHYLELGTPNPRVLQVTELEQQSTVFKEGH